MSPLPLPPVATEVKLDDGLALQSPSKALAAISNLTSAVTIPETELRRWRRIFDANATVERAGEKCVITNFPAILYVYSPIPPRTSSRHLDPDSFVDAIAPSGDLSKIGRSQFSILFKVADSSKRGLVSWDDFTIFQTMLKRPDADYWIAFQYFDVCVIYSRGQSHAETMSLISDSSGTISFEEFKNVFSSSLGSDGIPFDFDWYIVHYLPSLGNSHLFVVIGSNCTLGNGAVLTSLDVSEPVCQN